MIFITSISPTHINGDIQKVAINSWADYGIVYSFNTPTEIELLKEKYRNVTFIPTSRTMQHTFGKPYVSISAIFDSCKRIKYEKHFCIINSDIQLELTDELFNRIEKKLETSMIVANRNDYTNDFTTEKTKPYLDGIDVFFINKKHLNIYPQSLLCLGQCHFDYWLPYTALKNGMEVIQLQNKIAFHKRHKVQYNYKNWETTGRIFATENGMFGTNIQNMTEKVKNFIYEFMKKEII